MRKILLFLTPILILTGITFFNQTTTVSALNFAWDTAGQLKTYVSGLIATEISDSLASAVIDSGNVPAGALSWTDMRAGGFVNGQFKVGAASLPNAKTVFNVKGIVGAQDTLFSLARSNGNTVAFCDSNGKALFKNGVYVTSSAAYGIDLNGDQVSGTIYPQSDDSKNLGSILARYANLYIKKIFVSLEQSIAGTDSALTFTFTSGSPEINLFATDGDTYKIGINTSDQAVFSGASGGYLYDAPVGVVGTPNAKTIFAVKGIVGAQDTLQSWQSSNGNTVSFIDSLGSPTWTIGTSVYSKIYSAYGGGERALEISGLSNAAYEAAVILKNATGGSGSGVYVYNSTGDCNWFYGKPYTGTTSDIFAINRYFKTSFDANAATLKYALMELDSTGVISSRNGFSIKPSPYSTTADSSVTVSLSSGSPEINLFGTDADTYKMSINTSDQAVFSGATGGYSFDAPVEIGKYLQITKISAWSDTAGWANERFFISPAGGDTLYHYKADHTLGHIP